MHKKNNYAFTLAEVLITLGIIGVVAAMTLPTLIQNYRKNVAINQLKKSYSLLNQAWQNIIVAEDVEKITNTEFYENVDKYCAFSNFDKDKCEKLMNKYIDMTWIQDPEYFYIIGLKDGTALIDLMFNRSTKNLDTCKLIQSLGGNMCSTAFDFILDINGSKNPNKIGIDRFRFYVSDSGHLFPIYGKDYALYQQQTDLSGNSNYWKNIEDSTESCAAEIIENSWQATENCPALK